MRFSLLVEPEDGVSYAVLTKLARRAEARGFDGLYVSDHYEPAFGWYGVGAPDSWCLLAGLAGETSHIAIGTLVSPVTLRRFSTLAKMVATVAYIADDVHQPSGSDAPSESSRPSRVHLGLGAGWLEAEHHHIGLPFPPAKDRVDLLEEHLCALHRLWDPAESRVDFAGRHITLREVPFAPRALPRPRIIVGGKGKVRMPRLAAQLADEFNVPFVTEPELRMLRDRLDDACHAIGRDPDTVTYSAKRGILVGATHAELVDRARRMQELAHDTRPVEDYIAWLRTRWIVGSPEQAAAQISEFRSAGVDHVILQHLLPDDLATLDLISAEIIPSCT